MNGSIIHLSLYTRPVGFKIICKQDAMRFLNELISPASHFVFDDLNNPNYNYIVSRKEGGDAPATIAHERKGRSIFEPDLMHCDIDAVNMVYDARKSINRKFFSDGD